MRSRLGAARRYTRRARREAAVDRARHASLAGETLKTLQLARRLGGRAPRDDDPLAPRRLKTVLAPEVPTWPTADSSTITGSDPPHGEREPFVGEKRIANKLEHRSRRLIHCNVTTHPAAAWTLQQLRETTGFQRRYDYLLHDRDSIFAQHFGESGEKLGIRVLKSPPRRPLLFGVSRLTMMSNGQYQHELFRGQPAVLGNVAITAAQQNEFTTPVFGISTQ